MSDRGQRQSWIVDFWATSPVWFLWLALIILVLTAATGFLRGFSTLLKWVAA